MSHVLILPQDHSLTEPDRFTSEIARKMIEQASSLSLRYQPYWTAADGTTCSGLMDDFFVVESLETGRFKVIDFQDCYMIAYGLSKSLLFAGAAIMMFHPPTVHQRYGVQTHQIHPGWFLDQRPSRTFAFREEAAALRNGQLDSRLFFRGTIDGETPNYEYQRNGRSIREVALVLREKYPDEVDISGHKLHSREWLTAAASHRWVLTLPGHPWCYREFEMMSLGIPTITLRWTSFLYHQPVHYVAVDGLEQDPIGFALDPEAAADAIISKFRQVRDDEILMRSVGAQAQRWYDRYMSVDAIAEDILTFLDLDRL